MPCWELVPESWPEAEPDVAALPVFAVAPSEIGWVSSDLPAWARLIDSRIQIAPRDRQNQGARHERVNVSLVRKLGGAFHLERMMADVVMQIGEAQQKFQDSVVVSRLTFWWVL